MPAKTPPAVTVEQLKSQLLIRDAYAQLLRRVDELNSESAGLTLQASQLKDQMDAFETSLGIKVVEK